MKRFYQTAAIVEADDGFGVTLDGKTMRTPGKSPLIVPRRALAEAIAAEWAAQGEMVEPATLALTRLANSTIDVVIARREHIIDETARYAGTDMLCYRADGPDSLVGRQDARWQPLLDWMADRHGVRLEVTRAILPAAQTDQALDRVRAVVAAFDDYPLTAVHAATTASSSVVIALALASRRLTADAAFEASQLDETFQIEQWGEDGEATRRRDALRRGIAVAAHFLELCG